MLVVRGLSFSDFHISMIPTTGENSKKICEARVTCFKNFVRFDIELPH